MHGAYSFPYLGINNVCWWLRNYCAFSKFQGRRKVGENKVVDFEGICEKVSSRENQSLVIKPSNSTASGTNLPSTVDASSG